MTGWMTTSARASPRTPDRKTIIATTLLPPPRKYAAGKIPARTQPRHRHQEFPRIL
jgi:hypothetical protein